MFTNPFCNTWTPASNVSVGATMKPIVTLTALGSVVMATASILKPIVVPIVNAAIVEPALQGLQEGLTATMTDAVNRMSGANGQQG